jgi:hypothetical protein
MGLPRDLVGAVRRLDEGQLRQLLILARGLLLTSEHPVVQIDDVPGMPTARYRQRLVSCGKATCTACPHGPYWYAHWTEDGRRRSRYIGAELPAEVRQKLEEMDRRIAAAAPDEPVAVPLAAAGGDAGRAAGSGVTRALRLVGD